MSPAMDSSLSRPDRGGSSYVSRLQELLTQHADVFCELDRRAAEHRRVRVVTSPGRGGGASIPTHRSRQLALPLRPTMRR